MKNINTAIGVFGLALCGVFAFTVASLLTQMVREAIRDEHEIGRAMRTKIRAVIIEFGVIIAYVIIVGAVRLFTDI